MGIVAFSFEPEPAEAFFALGNACGHGGAQRTPTAELAERRALAASAPFFAAPGHEHRRFLANGGGRPQARALASIRPDLRDRDGTPVGAVGYFETLDDGAGLEVLAAAVEWLRARGVRRVWGPLQLDIWHGYRFLTRGFEASRHLGEPCNPPRYPELFSRFGFGVRQRWTSFALPGRPALAELAAAGRGELARLAAEGYRFDSPRRLTFERTLALLHGAVNESFSRFLGFTPIPFDEFRELYAVVRWAFEPRASIFAAGPSGEPVAFAASFRDLAAALAAANGPSLQARARFLFERLRARRLLLHSGGLRHQPEARGRGLARAVVARTAERILRAGYQDVLVTLVAEGNPVRRYFGRHALDGGREYALFQLDLRP